MARKIYIGKSGEDRRRILDAIKDRFVVEDDKARDFLEMLTSMPFDAEDVDSALTQARNDDRQAIQVSLTHHEPAFDYLLWHQQVWTGYADTAADPNPAIRHKGFSELMLRRLTYGDHLLALATYELSLQLGEYDRPAYEMHAYPAKLYNRLIPLLLRISGYPASMFGQCSSFLTSPHVTPLHRANLSAKLIARTEGMHRITSLPYVRRMLDKCGLRSAYVPLYNGEPATLLASEATDDNLNMFAIIGILHCIDDRTKRMLVGDLANTSAESAVRYVIDAMMTGTVFMDPNLKNFFTIIEKDADHGVQETNGAGSGTSDESGQVGGEIVGDTKPVADGPAA